MNHCPKCGEVYGDETLRFCRTDGAALVAFSSVAPTAVFGATGSSLIETAVVAPRPRSVAKSKSNDSIAVERRDNRKHRRSGAIMRADRLRDGWSSLTRRTGLVNSNEIA